MSGETNDRGLPARVLRTDGEPCHECGAPLAPQQRWCVVCGTRQAGADPRALLFPPSVATTADPLSSSSSRSPLLGVRARRRAALPLALASLVGLVVITGPSVTASVADSSPQSPFTVRLPQQVAQTSAPAAATTTAEVVEETVEPAPLPTTPVTPAPAVTPAPVTAAPAATTPVTPATETPADDRPADDESAAAERRSADEPAPATEEREEASPIRHVFVVALGGADLTALAGDANTAPYLGTLVESGTLLSDYVSVARGGLADRIALISGQGPTAQTLAACTTFGDVAPADPLANGQTGGDGCVYGAETGHLGDQLRGLELSWKAYTEPAAGTAAACAADAASSRRNPFLWFRGTVEADDCDSRVVPFARFGRDLKKAATTPALSWIASDAQQGSADADAFLERVIPLIQESPAYVSGGLIVILGDQPAAVAPADPAAPAAPAAPTTPAAPQVTAGDFPPGPTSYANVGDAIAAGAGVPVGALLISPFTPAGRRHGQPANAFTLLRTLQEIYGVDPLGYAAGRGVEALPARLFAVRP